MCWVGLLCAVEVRLGRNGIIDLLQGVGHRLVHAAVDERLIVRFREYLSLVGVCLLFGFRKAVVIRHGEAALFPAVFSCASDLLANVLDFGNGLLGALGWRYYNGRGFRFWSGIFAACNFASKPVM